MLAVLLLVFVLVNSQCVYQNANYACGSIITPSDLALECCFGKWYQCRFGRYGVQCPLPPGSCSCCPCSQNYSVDDTDIMTKYYDIIPKIFNTKAKLYTTVLVLADYNATENKYYAGKIIFAKDAVVGNLILWPTFDTVNDTSTKNSVVEIEQHNINPHGNTTCCRTEKIGAICVYSTCCGKGNCCC